MIYVDLIQICDVCPYTVCQSPHSLPQLKRRAVEADDIATVYTRP